MHKSNVYLTEKPHELEQNDYAESSFQSAKRSCYPITSPASSPFQPHMAEIAESKSWLTQNMKSPNRTLPKIIKNADRDKERGGGGLIYPGAPQKLLDILKRPKVNS